MYCSWPWIVRIVFFSLLISTMCSAFWRCLPANFAARIPCTDPNKACWGVEDRWWSENDDFLWFSHTIQGEHISNLTSVSLSKWVVFLAACWWCCSDYENHTGRFFVFAHREFGSGSQFRNGYAEPRCQHEISHGAGHWMAFIYIHNWLRDWRRKTW